MKKRIAAIVILFVICILYPACIIVLSVPIVALVRECHIENKYQKGTYYRDTKLPYAAMKEDSGRYGEYLIYKNLQHREGIDGKFLFNTYIPTDEANTTEIDVMFLCRKGIFVFESKNHSGWVFGKESQQNWTQTLPQGRKSHKEHFYNPIRQNAGHIAHLQKFTGEKMRFYSVITFSDRCTIKAMEVESKNVFVLHRREVEEPIKAVYEYCEDIMTQEDLDALYAALYPFTQVNEEVKSEHVANINQVRKRDGAEALEEKGAAEESPVENTLEEETKQSSIVEKMESEERLICPWCRGKLVMRTAHRGERAGKHFYGCENYPKCKYVRNIDE